MGSEESPGDPGTSTLLTVVVGPRTCLSKTALSIIASYSTLWSYFKSDCAIANSDGKLLFIIKAFEIACAPDAELIPITDNRREERLTAIWQSTSFPFSPIAASPGFSWLAAAGRNVIRAVLLGEDLRHRYYSNIQATLGELVVESSASVALQGMQWSRRGCSLSRLEIIGEDVESSMLTSFDLVLHDVNLAAVPVDISSSANFLDANLLILWSRTGPHALAASGVHVEDASVGALTLAVPASLRRGSDGNCKQYFCRRGVVDPRGLTTLLAWVPPLPFVIGTAITQRQLSVPTASSVSLQICCLSKPSSVRQGHSLDIWSSQNRVTYEDIVAQAKSFSSGCGYFKHLFALGGMNVETISQLEFNHFTPKYTISLPNGEEQYQFLHLRNGHVILRSDNHFYTEEAARRFLDAYVYLMMALDGTSVSRSMISLLLANNLRGKYKCPAGLVLQIATGNAGRATTTISFPSHIAPRLIFGSHIHRHMISNCPNHSVDLQTRPPRKRLRGTSAATKGVLGFTYTAE
ncbi:hypothetical protein BU15DRAFT_66098 [Melanogaster broomeanus]|nr:hypothetical protein BU15DRAFT_66098 [Melanogaster broomeanus]